MRSQSQIAWPHHLIWALNKKHLTLWSLILTGDHSSQWKLWLLDHRMSVLGKNRQSITRMSIEWLSKSRRRLTRWWQRRNKKHWKCKKNSSNLHLTKFMLKCANKMNHLLKRYFRLTPCLKGLRQSMYTSLNMKNICKIMRKGWYQNQWK